MKGHSQIEALFADYDRLTRGDQRELEAHAAGCPACAARLVDYRRMERDFARLRDPLPGPQLDAAVRRGLAEAQQPLPAGAGRMTARSRTAHLAPLLRYGAAAAVLVVLAGWLLFRDGGLLERILPPRAGAAIPAAHSALVESFAWQTDGAYGYQMLRPRGWTPVDESRTGGWRAFEGPGAAGDAGSISMMAANLDAGKDVAAGQRGDYAIGGTLLQLFERDRTLPGWTAAFEEEAGRGSALLEQLRALPDAKIYMWNLDPAAGAAQFMLLGLKVDAGKPLVVVVFAGGSYADVQRLQREGFVDDLATMIESARAIPADAKNVVPWLADVVPTTVSLPVPALAPGLQETLTPPAARAGPPLLMTPTPAPTPSATGEPATAGPTTPEAQQPQP